MVVIDVPERTHEQRLAALVLANDTRVYMKEQKALLAVGEALLGDVLADPRCATMYVLHAVRAVPGVGPMKADRVLMKSGTSPAKRCGGLTARQRMAIVSIVGAYPARKVLA